MMVIMKAVNPKGGHISNLILLECNQLISDSWKDRAKQTPVLWWLELLMRQHKVIKIFFLIYFFFLTGGRIEITPSIGT